MTFSLNGQSETALFTVSEMAATGVRTVQWTHWTPTGNSGFSSLPIPAGVTFDSVSGAFFNKKIHLTAKDEITSQVYIGYLNLATGGFSGFFTALVAGKAVTSQYLPDIVTAPDGNLYMFTVGTGLLNEPKLGTLHTYSSTAGSSWTHLSKPGIISGAGPGGMSQGAGPFAITDHKDVNCTVGGPVSAEYQNHIDHQGNSLPKGNGAFWLWYQIECNTLSGTEVQNTINRFSRGSFDSSGPGPNFSMGRLSSTPFSPGDVPGSGCFIDEIPGAKTALFRSQGKISAIVSGIPDNLAFVSDPKKERFCADTLVHFPHADGLTSVVLSDTNDHLEIELAICSSLGGIRANCENPLSTSNPHVSCD